MHYYAPREKLIERAYDRIIGDDPESGGHYVTVWAPRQTGKTWTMLEVMKKIWRRDDFCAGIITMQSAKEEKTDEGVLDVLVTGLRNCFEIDLPEIRAWKQLSSLFTREYFSKPVILILDEFDSLKDEFINKFANEFRSIYTSRLNEPYKKSGEKSCLLHALALIGVRSVLGVESATGSPFNVQRSLHIPNLGSDEVHGIFNWRERESGQKIEPEVIDRIYSETRGQPGLTCWYGELLTETYNEDRKRPITIEKFNQVNYKAIRSLPNNNMINIMSKVAREPYKGAALELFRTEEKVEFSFDDPEFNYLYMNGVIGREITETVEYVRFASPFIQKRLFNRFSKEFIPDTGKLFEPFEDISQIISEKEVNIENLMRRYEIWLKKNREWLLKDAPRRKDLRIFEAVHHFNLYRYLYDFFKRKQGQVFPEFPAGNGRIDLVIHYKGRTYGIEVKTYTDETGYREALDQAAMYGSRLQLSEISLVFFVERVDDQNRKKYETPHVDDETGVKVRPIFVETGE